MRALYSIFSKSIKNFKSANIKDFSCQQISEYKRYFVRKGFLKCRKVEVSRTQGLTNLKGIVQYFKIRLDALKYITRDEFSFFPIYSFFVP